MFAEFLFLLTELKDEYHPRNLKVLAIVLLMVYELFDPPEYSCGILPECDQVYVESEDDQPIQYCLERLDPKPYEIGVGETFAVQLDLFDWSLFKCTFEATKLGNKPELRSLPVVNNVTMTDQEDVIVGQRYQSLRPKGKTFKLLQGMYIAVKTKSLQLRLGNIIIPLDLVRATKLTLEPTQQYNISNRAIRKTQLEKARERARKQTFRLNETDFERIESIIAELNLITHDESRASSNRSQKRKCKENPLNPSKRKTFYFDKFQVCGSTLEHGSPDKHLPNETPWTFSSELEIY